MTTSPVPPSVHVAMLSCSRAVNEMATQTPRSKAANGGFEGKSGGGGVVFLIYSSLFIRMAERQG